jgi:tRNA(Leu) C34 or U34 (ribose-2'-O)-methylase TrmL
MAIITISKLLREAGLDISKKIKLVRHKDCRSSQIVDGIEKKGSPYDW